MDQHLLVFVMAAEKENFSRAAEELHMTQPAVSQYIRSLEEMVGARLLERSNKYVRLTQAGEIVYHHAKEILNLQTKMQRLVDDLANKTSGPLSIGASYTFGEYVLPHIMAKMLDSYPLVRPAITIGNTKEIAELVMNRQLDAGIIEGDYQNRQLRVEALSEDKMHIVASPRHRLSQRGEKVLPQELEQERWIVREKGSGTREAAEEVFSRLGITPAQKMKFGSIQLIKESVEAGLGISLLSELAVRKELAAGSICKLETEGLPYTRQFSIVTCASFHTKALETFLQMLGEFSISK